MNVLNLTVKHAIFGTGRITQQDETVLTVTFPKPYGEKKFVYPNAFSKYLTLCDASLRPEMKQELLSYRKQVAEERDRAERARKLARLRADSAANAKKKPRAKTKK